MAPMIYTLKRGVDSKDLQMIQPALWILLTRTFLYCAEYELPCRITSLINDRKGVKATSRTHESGRAVDISVRGWSETHKYRFQYVMNQEYSDIAAISASDHKPRAVVLHDSGRGPHLHIQVRPNAKWHKFIKE